MIKQIFKTASACILSAGIGFGVGAAPATATLTDALTQYDQTTIEQDLASVDLSVYAKDGNGRHRLIDEAGFMEYAYSSDASVAEDYFGIYFYVYNPTGREVSSRTGANVVNMAVAYDTEGEPTEYANCAITIPRSSLTIPMPRPISSSSSPSAGANFGALLTALISI